MAMASDHSRISTKFSNKLIQNDLIKMEKPELVQLILNLQTRFGKLEENNVDLRAELTDLTDQRDLLQKKIEDELIDGEKLKQIQEQILHKDKRIMELNSEILAKEMKIIDLQEMCSEQGQVAHSKSIAVALVNTRLRELDSKRMVDASTEMDFKSPYEPSSIRNRSPRRQSPGRAIPQFKLGISASGNGSPPPVDPAEDCSSYTTETLNIESNDVVKGRKSRKKVTFDVHADINDMRPFDKQIDGTVMQSRREPIISTDYEELLTENDQLRQIISDMEKSQISKKINPETLQVLKAKAISQAKIKELEGIAAQNKLNSDEEIFKLQSIIKQLNESRDWILDENAKLQNQLQNAKKRCDDLYEELDASQATTDVFRKKSFESAQKVDEIMSELYQSRAMLQQVSDEKAISENEIERLKEALLAQDEFITLLEGDLIVYEAHVGILRDSLGASKKEDRQTIKSKAFTAKINALETEKQQIVKKNNEEKLRAKALAIKIRFLEEENGQLKTALRNSDKDFTTTQAPSTIDSDKVQEILNVSTMTTENLTQSIELLEQQIKMKTFENDNLSKEKQEIQEKSYVLSAHLIQFSVTVSNFLLSLSPDPQEGDAIAAIQLEDGDFSEKLQFVERKFLEFIDHISILKNSRDSLQEKLDAQQKQITTLTANIEEVTEQKHKVEQKLLQVNEEYNMILIKIQQNDQLITSLEQRNADLARNLSENRSTLLSVEEERKLFKEEKEVLEQRLDMEMQSFMEENAKLENQLKSTKEEKEAFAQALADEKKRLNKLVEILTEIVDQFKAGTSSEGFSNDLYDLIGKLKSSNAKSPTVIDKVMSVEECVVELPPEDTKSNSAAPKASTFSKAVSVQVNMTKEEEEFHKSKENELQLVIAQQQSRMESLENELSDVSKSVSEKQIQLESKTLQNDELEGKCTILMTQLDHLLELEISHQKSQVLNRELTEQLNKSHDKIYALTLQQENAEKDANKKTGNYFHANTQTETANFADEHIQTDCPTNPNQMDCVEMESESTQTETVEVADISVQSSDVDKMEQQHDVSEDSQHEETLVVRQQRHQLLMECIQDREAFERHLGDNVQQLVELKVDLESSVEILKGEIWSLNQELKRRFDEGNCLKTRLDQLNQLLNECRAENEEFRNEIQAKDKQMAELKEQLDGNLEGSRQIGTELTKLHLLHEEKSHQVKTLENLVAALNSSFKSSTQTWRAELEELKHFHLESTEQLLASVIDAISLCKDEIQQLTAARLTTKVRDNDSLVRENAHLIGTNVRLQEELDRLNSLTTIQQPIFDDQEVTVDAHFIRQSADAAAETEEVLMLTPETLMVGFQNDMNRIEEQRAMIAGEKSILSQNASNQIGNEEEPPADEKVAEEMGTIDNTVEESGEIQEQQQIHEGETTAEDWNWEGEEEGIEERKQMENDEVEATVDDWNNWGNEQEEEVQAENSDMKGAEKTIKDEWTWDDDGAEEDEDVEDPPVDSANSNIQVGEKVKQLFEDW